MIQANGQEEERGKWTRDKSKVKVYLFEPYRGSINVLRLDEQP